MMIFFADIIDKYGYVSQNNERSLAKCYAFEFKINKKILAKTSRYHLSDENVWFVFPFDVARCTLIEIQVIWHFVNVHAVTTHFYFARIHCAMHSTTISQFI